MKKIDFIEEYEAILQKLPDVEDSNFPVLLALLYCIIFIPCVLGFLVAVLLHPVQELVLLLYVILKVPCNFISKKFRTLYKL